MAVACVYSWEEGGLNKDTMVSASTSDWEKATPSALTPKPDN